MDRRTVIVSTALGLLAQLPYIRSARAQSPPAAAPSSNRPDYERFIKIAKEKGAQIFFNQPRTAAAFAEKQALHLDMNMVRASLELAIEGAEKKGSTALRDKLRRLATTGTPVQQAEFVLGSGEYYFPEDIEKALSQGGKIAVPDVDCWVCENVCYVVCRCKLNGDQYCDDRCRDICHKYC